MIGFAETIFSWPGVGKWMIDAIARRDYPVLQGGIFITAVLMMGINLFVDVLLCLGTQLKERKPAKPAEALPVQRTVRP
jgi:ABC-type antimicrobial peptide transport system permease subunit